MRSTQDLHIKQMYYLISETNYIPLCYLHHAFSVENKPRRYQKYKIAVQQTDHPESIVTRQLHKMTRVGNMAGTKAFGEE